MERKKYLWTKFFWTAVIIELAMVTTATNVSTVPPPKESREDAEPSGYAWSPWGSWSACSRTCGGGVAVQERQCLPRARLVPEGTLSPPIITVRITRQAPGDCQGVARRYHECNTAPCTGGARDVRAEQCAAYDRRPFRGRFYTWVPYIDGDAPCMLNCRPLGQHFYASLALVADGTPCTKPGFRAICVQGTCKVVGRESVLASTSMREVRCGRRLVSGLFSRPRLPLGYSYVTTVPRGACRLNVSEILPSENYIALKITNGSYIMNGEFAVSSPGNYEAAGTRFLYSRVGAVDSVFAMGPIHDPIDIMVLYTQPNPSIRYEYFTESLPGEVDIETATRPNIPDILSTAQTKHIRRHHSFDSFPRPANSPRHPDVVGMSREVSSEVNAEDNVIGDRRFMWKILSYSQCSRTCGGGIQVGKYRCVESTSNTDREVSPIHCTGSAPAGRRRRCGNVPCAPRWRAAAWSTCPQCGPATRTRIVGCVQDHSRGITKVSDQKCPAPKPATIEACNIPICESFNKDIAYLGSRKVRPRGQDTDTFRDGPVYTITVNDTDLDVGPAYSISDGVAAGWLFTDWSECTGWCVGGGIQTRGVRCADPSGCAPRKSPDASRACTPIMKCEPHEGQWFTGDWSPCSAQCGGKQVRGVLCIGGTGRHLRDSACKEPKPEQQRDCDGDCQPSWYYSEWGQCMSNCTFGIGIQRRTVWCAKQDGASDELDCGTDKPPAERTCDARCPAVPVTALPPDLTIESQKVSGLDTTTTTTTTSRNIARETQPYGCEDKLRNCALAVQARLCHYNYYQQKCCSSCRSR